ncbi:hypothetical protein GC722_00580 [Auraticoccus sp. F435]|uniref:Gram-positive cocci surface proteins LPxTG domain-containing protein n=1 Tax=Auraticoccus cholistanensis TaxID=2656650 RepID=A0A6A9UPR9_9ACTN|nr:DUF5979 domain-containing protein [Auraticoccus cholistanensis]MVA74538.1 hypothetical protein [Auraticoccus cholistanensis]
MLRRILLVLLATLVALGGAVTTPAHAENQAYLTLEKSADGLEPGATLQPGESFVYRVQVTCINTEFGGCTDAAVTDPLPEWVERTGGEISVTGGGEVVVRDESPITVEFRNPLTEPAGAVGMEDASTATILIPVRLSEDVPASVSGTELVNTATATADNADEVSDSFTVVPEVAVDLAAEVTKSFAPDEAVLRPGEATTLTVEAGNDSNVGVQTLTVTDPAEPGGAPFDSLALTAAPVVELPAGAERADVEYLVDGSWVAAGDGGAFPSGVDPGDVTGLRVTFVSTDDEPIGVSARGRIQVPLEQRAEAQPGVVPNVASAVVAVGDGGSEPATGSAEYTVVEASIPVEASKTIRPREVVAGGRTTVTLGATNTSSRVLDSLSLTEPGGEENFFTDRGFRFEGFSEGVVWPSGAEQAAVTWRCADGTAETSTEVVDTLPSAPEGCAVAGFTVTFTGELVAGAEAVVPFEVTAPTGQQVDELSHDNQVRVDSAAPGGYTGSDTATDRVTTIVDRLSVEVGKRISPSRIPAVPGETAVIQLSGRITDFPSSTVDATRLVVSDPADDDPDNAWWQTFDARSIVQTPVPAEAEMTVQHLRPDGSWADVPGMVGIAGPTTFTATVPGDLEVRGLRFVYTSDAGFPPGQEVNPNVVVALSAGTPNEAATVENCASSDASAATATADRASTPQPCPSVELVPVVPGEGDLLEKDWDQPKTVGERTGDEAGLTLSWSTAGRSGLDEVVLSDVPDPAADRVAETVFDTFDLVRVDRITAEQDPLLRFDRVERVELFDATSQQWVRADADPCPAACDGTFPGVALSAEERASTIGVRLVYAESPTRAERVERITDPAVGSGVARTFELDRHVHLVLAVRDELRSDPRVPVLSGSTYNEGEPGEVRNDARATGYTDGQPVVGDDASDVITIVEVNLSVTVDKTWSGGPLGVPVPGTDPAAYPSGRASIVAVNTTPRRIDQLTITEPSGGTDPFEVFDLTDFTSLTAPASIGAGTVVVRLVRADGSTVELDHAAALAADAASLADVTGFTVVYSGRIVEGARAQVTFDTRLRPAARTTGEAPQPGQVVENAATVLGEDLVHHDVPTDTFTDRDDASVELRAQGIGVTTTKVFEPDTQTEPRREPVTMTLTGRPSGPTRTAEMVVEDSDAGFFNQYDFVGFADGFRLTAPIDRVRVDVLTGGTFTVVDGDVRLVGATWQEGTSATAPALPAGVAPEQVQGLRFTFVRADGRIWENPATPTQSIPLLVQRRLELHTGGPVPSTLAGSVPAPGEEVTGQAGNRVSTTVRGREQGPDGPLSASDEAEDTITYRHARNSVEVTKTPAGGRQPQAVIPFQLTFTNTGDVPVVDPVITDRIPTDGSGPLLQLDPEAEAEDVYSFELEGAAPEPANGPAMPTELGLDGVQAVLSEEGDLITFTFPPGTVLEVGQTYTVGVQMRFRPGLPGNTQVTNVTGITGERPWDECRGTLAEDGRCTDDTTVHPIVGGALRGEKTVRAEEELDVLDTRASGSCEPDEDGFHRAGCVPVSAPGSEVTWRMTFTNTGNLPLRTVRAVDRLPDLGDTAAMVPSPRGSQWRPLLEDVRLVGAEGGTVSDSRVYWTDQDELCLDDLRGRSCAEGEWQPLTDETDPADVRALMFEFDLAEDLLDPTGTVTVDLVTRTPAQAEGAGDDQVAWNTVASSAVADDQGRLTDLPPTEGNRVGVALATGPLQITKVVQGGRADVAPETFRLEVVCTSAGEPVDLGERGVVTVRAGELVTVEDLPHGASCTVADDRAGSYASGFDATSVTVRRDPVTVPVITATNTYGAASLVLDKRVEGPLDAAGQPLEQGPFTVEVVCTLGGRPVAADGHVAGEPMVVELVPGQPVTLTGVPTGAVCDVTETATGGASATTVVAENAATSSEGETSVRVTVTADDADGATTVVTFTNVFPTAEVTITKVVQGPGAATWGTGSFEVQLVCTVGGRTVWDGTVVLGGDHPLEATVGDLADGASCVATETQTGGATTSTVAPEGPFVVAAGQPSQVVVTNTFEVGSVQATKRVVGPAPAGAEFTFELRCLRTAGGAALEVPGGAARTVRADEVVSWDGLPVGAVCAVVETDAAGADQTTVDVAEVVVAGEVAAPVVVTNTYEPEPEPTPEPTPPPEPTPTPEPTPEPTPTPTPEPTPTSSPAPGELPAGDGDGPDPTPGPVGEDPQVGDGTGQVGGDADGALASTGGTALSLLLGGLLSAGAGAAALVAARRRRR